MSMLGTTDPLCITCHRRLSQHVQPSLMCIQTYFTPCKHERRRGTVVFGDPSKNEATCETCFERLTGEDAFTYKAEG